MVPGLAEKNDVYITSVGQELTEMSQVKNVLLYHRSLVHGDIVRRQP